MRLQIIGSPPEIHTHARVHPERDPHARPSKGKQNLKEQRHFCAQECGRNIRRKISGLPRLVSYAYVSLYPRIRAHTSSRTIPKNLDRSICQASDRTGAVGPRDSKLCTCSFSATIFRNSTEERIAHDKRYLAQKRQRRSCKLAKSKVKLYEQGKITHDKLSALAKRFLSRKMRGIRTRSTTCGTSAMVPTMPDSKLDANVPRCPPASLPCVTTASAPARSNAPAGVRCRSDVRKRTTLSHSDTGWRRRARAHPKFRMPHRSSCQNFANSLLAVNFFSVPSSLFSGGWWWSEPSANKSRTAICGADDSL
jgi:hypothetical protein